MNSIGEGAVNLEHFRDQKKHDEGIVLRNEKEIAVGQIYLNLQWLHSRVKFMEDAVKKWEQTLNHDRDLMQKLEVRIRDLRAPFQNALENVVQSVSIQHQIYLSHQMYPGNCFCITLEKYDIKELLSFLWHFIVVMGLLQTINKHDLTSVLLPSRNSFVLEFTEFT
eukprot:TRINITY_DN9557_c0_g1_i2.p1 TRINITY_DN9557_c0_g1~~TRINITY_DN9557_c0_g1_i2.p1  ORF type:complete len:166 (-),score=18.10 TRINITY_DN9557_c0_g1_i2:489-986(-)